MVESRHVYSPPEDAVWWAVKQIKPDEGKPLPEPSDDQETLLSDLDTHGYCLVKDAIPKESLSGIRERLHEQMEAEQQLGVAPARMPNGAKMCFNLLNKGDIFQTCVLNDKVDAIMEHLLGDGFLLGGLAALQSVPGTPGQGLHFDQARFGMPVPAALVANCLYMLDDFTEENGGTRLIPGSHLWEPSEIERVYEPITSQPNENHPETIAATGPAGTALLFDGRLMHALGKNVSNQTRTGLITYYSRGWLRQTVNPFLAISDDIMMTFPKRLRELLGYKTWNFFGSGETVGVQPSLDVVRPTDQIRELRPQ